MKAAEDILLVYFMLMQYLQQTQSEASKYNWFIYVNDQNTYSVSEKIKMIELQMVKLYLVLKTELLQVLSGLYLKVKPLQARLVLPHLII